MDYCQNIRDFESILESAYERLREWDSTPLEIADDFLMEDVTNLVREIISQSTYFNCPIVISNRSMRTPLEGMQIVGQLLGWVREEMLRESPFLDIRQAVRYVGATSEKQIYGAIERGRLESMKCGKELRFTQDMLKGFMQR